jgi:hypoxanthine-guanine phosphoribosyltransferase
MMTVVNNLKERVENIITCSLLKKLRKDKVCYYDNPEHIYGFLISDYFAVGYGLDYNQKFRNIKNIFDYKEVDRYIKISGLDSFYEFSSNL